MLVTGSFIGYRQFFGVASATLSTMRQIGNMFSMEVVMLNVILHQNRVSKPRRL